MENTFTQLLRAKRTTELWQQYCGFLDLDVRGFLAVQERLLEEQLAQVAASPLGRALLGPRPPRTVRAFRQQMPLTDYDTYAPYLRDQDPVALAEVPAAWAHTSGRSGAFKWLPLTQRMLDVTLTNGLGIFVLACARQRGEVRLRPRDLFLHNTPAPPYATGWMIKLLGENTDFRPLPPLDQSTTMTFTERIESSFRMGLRYGVDVVCSISSVLVRVGEGFTSGANTRRGHRDLLHPAVLARIARAALRSRRERRPLLPRDLWSLKGMLVGGMDTHIYRHKLMEYWGVEPHEVYGATECPFIATQAWTRQGLYFLPNAAFFEFIPEGEWERSRADPTYMPQTVLLDEVEVGPRYEPVLTHFYGGPLLRYRMHDLVRFVAAGEPAAGIHLPSIVFEARSRDLIDLASFSGPMDEKQLWMALENTKLPYVEWTARKEVENGQAILHLYVEPKPPIPSEDEVRQRLHEQLIRLNPDYGDIETILGYHPLRVTLLPEGTFAAYVQAMVAQGADPAHLKPAHINANETAMRMLLEPKPTADPNHVGEKRKRVEQRP